MRKVLLKTDRLRLERYYALMHKHQASYSLISVKPLIFCLQYGYELENFDRMFNVLFEYLKDQQVYFLCFSAGYLEGVKIISAIKNLEEKYKKHYPGFVFIHLCSTMRQRVLFEEQNINAVFCNNNCMVDERLFFPQQAVEKKYDAVYDASLSPVKRHYLAAEIKNLALIFYYPSFNEIDMANSRAIKDSVSHAHFFNNIDPNDYKRLSPAEVNECLNQCGVGLCLSEEEGAMYASIQYLLAGLPVVTTPSRGGREVFFEDDYVLTVPPTPEAIKDGVQEIIRRNVPGEYIREKVLRKMQTHRQCFIDLVQEIYEVEGINRSFQDEWRNVFFNKLHTTQNHHKNFDFIQRMTKK